MDSEPVAKGAELSTAVCVACDERKAAVGNSGRTGTFILRCQFQWRQGSQVLFMRRHLLQTGVWTPRVVPGHVGGDVRLGRTHPLAARHGDLGRVQGPDLVGPRGSQAAQQVGIDLVPGCALAGAGLFLHALKP